MNDARVVAAALRDIGFDVLEGTDLDRAAQERMVRDFLRKAASARVALFYYAGHGMQVDGKNYLVPVDAKIRRRAISPSRRSSSTRCFPVSMTRRRTNIVILDACRDNPLAKTWRGGHVRPPRPGSRPSRT